MRSFILIVATAAALFAAFFIYTRLAAPVRVSVSDGPVIAATAPSAQTQPFAAGAWVNLYDKDGQLYGRLRTRVCTPEPDKRAALSDPEAEFYQHDGRIVRLTAHDGDVRLGGESDRSPLSGGPASVPSQGTLNDVNISLYAGPDARDLDEPDLTLHMDNTQFDADTYRLFTVARTDASGRNVPADRIPITVRGRDLDFDGWGLMVIWDGQVHELKSLLVAHGKRLRLKSGSAYQPPNAARGRGAGGGNSMKLEKESGKPPPVRVYRATFSDEVRVVPAGEEHGQSGAIQANQMIVTFAARNEGPVGAGPAPAGAARATPAGSAAMNQTADVYWSGTLRILPVAAGEVALLPGQATVRFTGASDQPLRLTTQRDGKTTGLVLASSADYSQGGPIIFSGNGVGVFSDPDKPDDVLHVAWSSACNLTLAGGGNQFQIQQADLLGGAEVHEGTSSGVDKLRLDARRITANFERGASDPHSAEIKQLVAEGQAHCLIHDEKEPDRAFTTDKLVIDTARDAAGNLYPRTITGTGHFHGVQDQDEIDSDRMVARVAPEVRGAKRAAGKGSFALQSFTASGNVHAKGKDGSTAAGDVLRVEQSDGRQVTTLLGAPMAIVSGGNGTIRGREIDIEPQAQMAWIVGHGCVDSVRAAEAGKPGSPIHVEWEKSATIDGAKNRIDVDGGVFAETVEAAGGKSSARGDHVVVDLVAAPSTRPAASKPARQGSVAGLDLLRDKQVKTVRLQSHAWIDTTQPAADGSIARRTHIEGSDIQTELPDQRLIVQGAGRMLLEDHSKKAAQKESSSGNSNSGHGVWGIQWQTKFTFDELAGRATIDGPDRIIQWSDSSPNGATEILADYVVADFNARNPKDANQEMTLKQLQAMNNVQITTFSDRAMTKPQRTVEAKTLVYDPLTEMLTITGGPDGRVRVTTAHTAQVEEADRVEINLRTHDFKVSDFSGQAR